MLINETRQNPERIFADTNLFLRYLTNDVPEQADTVEQLLLRAGAGQLILVTSVMVIAEMVWTLESFYKCSRDDIRSKVMAVMNTPGVDVIEKSLIIQAISDYVNKNVDFGDAYNVGWLKRQGLTAVYTFDRRHFARFEEIDVRVPGKD